MRFGEYILRNMELILDRGGVSATAGMRASRLLPPQSLRGHARGILQAIVAELESSQPREEPACPPIAGTLVAMDVVRRHVKLTP